MVLRNPQLEEERGKKKQNWIVQKEFLAIFRKTGISHQNTGGKNHIMKIFQAEEKEN